MQNRGVAKYHILHLLRKNLLLEFLNTFSKIFIINKGETNNVFRT